MKFNNCSGLRLTERSSSDYGSLSRRSTRSGVIISDDIDLDLAQRANLSGSDFIRSVESSTYRCAFLSSEASFSTARMCLRS